jgi:RNA polymerase sigma-70 factor (ECF subfamily)
MAVAPFDHSAALTACAHGDQKALQRLYMHEAPHMMALSTKLMGPGEDAEAAVRDTFVLVWKNAESYDSATATARAWLYSILRYRILHALRNARAAASAAATDDAPAQSNSDDAGYLSLSPDSLKRLDGAQRLPLLMAFFGGLTLDQIAARLALPPDQARAQLRTGLNAMQDQA